jgi:ElaB/YqjD/DUF883 family membrane-anchored ribosome-binding protein
MTELNAPIDAAGQQDAPASADTLRPLLDQLLAGMQQAVERLTDVATQVANQAEQSGHYVKDSQERAVRGARGYVRAQPLRSVGIALAAGFLLSWALRRR